MNIAAHQHTTACRRQSDHGAWVCPAPRATTEDNHDSEPCPDLVDVRDMIVVHTALLREFRLAPLAVGRVEAGDRRQALRVDKHLRFLSDLLHHHHAGEDELLWPALRARVPGAILTALEQVEAQHGAIDASLGRVTRARQAWAPTADATARELLCAELAHLRTLLAEHLDLEERAVLPWAACVLTEAEWHAIGDAAVQAMPTSRLPLVFGMFAYEADPVVLRSMLQTAPALPRLLLPKIAPKIHARNALRVHGTKTP